VKRADLNKSVSAPGKRTHYPYAKWLDGEINELHAPEDFDRHKLRTVVRAVNGMASSKGWAVICRAHYPFEGDAYIQVWGDMREGSAGDIPKDVLDWFIKQGYRPKRGRPKKA